MTKSSGFISTLDTIKQIADSLKPGETVVVRGDGVDRAMWAAFLEVKPSEVHVEYGFDVDMIKLWRPKED